MTSRRPNRFQQYEEQDKILDNGKLVTEKQHSKERDEVRSLERNHMGYMHNHRIEKQASVGFNTQTLKVNMSGTLNDEMYCVNQEHEHFSKNIFPDCDVCQSVLSSHNEAKLINKQSSSGISALQGSPTFAKQMKIHMRSSEFMAFANCDNDSQNSRKRMRRFSVISCQSRER